MPAIFQPNSIESLVSNVSETFDRWNSSHQALVFGQIETWIAELCQFRPIWFLDFYPNVTPAFPVTLPLSPIAGNWVGRCFLQVSPGQTRYQFLSPLVDSQATNPQVWAPVRVANVYNVAKQELDGSMCGSLRRVTPLSRTQVRLDYPACPDSWTFSTDETGSYLELYPVPDNYYLMQVCYSLASCDSYQMQDPNSNPATYSTYNRFLSYKPQIVKYYVMAKTAEYFDESKMKQDYMMQLFGVPNPGDLDGRKPIYKGQVGALNKESIEKSRTMSNIIEPYESARTAFNSMDPRGGGRGGGYGYYGQYQWRY